jgi:hypothetical protein
MNAEQFEDLVDTVVHWMMDHYTGEDPYSVGFGFGLGIVTAYQEDVSELMRGVKALAAKEAWVGDENPVNLARKILKRYRSSV